MKEFRLLKQNPLFSATILKLTVGLSLLVGVACSRHWNQKKTASEPNQQTDEKKSTQAARQYDLYFVEGWGKEEIIVSDHRTVKIGNWNALLWADGTALDGLGSEDLDLQIRLKQDPEIHSSSMPEIEVLVTLLPKSKTTVLREKRIYPKVKRMNDKILGCHLVGVLDCVHRPSDGIEGKPIPGGEYDVEVKVSLRTGPTLSFPAFTISVNEDFAFSDKYYR